MGLVVDGLVNEFHLFEISAERIRAGKEQASSLGISHRVHFYEVDALEVCRDKDFELVYWNNALHHMMDTDVAVSWSRDRLSPGGIFAMDDFIGPSRFQWTDRSLKIASNFRSSLPNDMLRSPHNVANSEPTVLVRPAIASMIQTDPSEAADSDNIIPAIRRYFPEATMTFTGGVIYHHALNNILANFDEDSVELKIALVLDDAMSSFGENHYAVSFAQKTSS
jgi:SAM-dependent methyltransferase